jgi:CheY-like chemotaxis protein
MHELTGKPPANGSAAIDASRLRALIIDESELSRSVISAMLREFGVTHPHTARRPEEARRMIKGAIQPYDLIVTEFHFARLGQDESMSGQDLLDELRQARGLPMQTAFIMVTDEARYQHVADALEGALDDYIIKPFTAAHFEQRLRQVLARKLALRAVFQAIEAGDYGAAAQECERIFRDSAAYRVYAARIGSELYLRLNQLDAARRMLEAVLAMKAVPWARLGLAKIELSSAEPERACRTLETLLAENPAYVDAYDVYGRALLEQMDFAGAVEVFAKAVQITPGNLGRLQKLGSLQLLLGQADAAQRHLLAALNLGAHSRALDYQGLVALAIAQLDLGGNHEEAGGRARQCLVDALQRYPDSHRLQTLLQCLDIAQALGQRRGEAASAGLAALAAQLERPEFTFEMASNLILLLVRSAQQLPLPQAMAWIEQAALRFCISHPRTRLLELAAATLPAAEALVRDTAATVNEEAREAMGHLVNKQHGRTLQALLSLAQRSHNARIISLAQATLAHHGQHLAPAEAEALRQGLETLAARWQGGERAIVARSG